MKKLFFPLVLFFATPGKAPIFFSEKTLENLEVNPEFKIWNPLIKELRILQGCYIELFGAELYTGQYFQGFLDSKGAFSFTHHQEIKSINRLQIKELKNIEEFFEEAKNTLNKSREENHQENYEEYILNLKNIDSNKYKDFLFLLLKIDKLHKKFETLKIVDEDKNFMYGLLSEWKDLLVKSNMKFMQDDIYKDTLIAMKILLFLSKSDIVKLLFCEENYKKIFDDLTAYTKEYATQYLYTPPLKEDDSSVVDFFQPYKDFNISMENILQDLKNSNFLSFMNYINFSAIVTRLYFHKKIKMPNNSNSICDFSGALTKIFIAINDFMIQKDIYNLEIDKRNDSPFAQKMLERFEAIEKKIHDFLVPNDFLTIEEINNFFTQRIMEFRHMIKDMSSSISHMFGFSLEEINNFLKNISPVFNFFFNPTTEDQIKITMDASNMVDNLISFSFQSCTQRLYPLFLNLPLKPPAVKENSYEKFHEEFKKIHRELQEKNEFDFRHNVNYIGDLFRDGVSNTFCKNPNDEN